MFNPDSDENIYEYVEVYNRSDESVILTGHQIGDSDAFDPIVSVMDKLDSIPPHGFGLILDPDYFENSPIYTIPSDVAIYTVSDKAIGSRGLSNSSAETVTIVSDKGDTLTQVTYDISCPPGHSWERILPEKSDSQTNFSASHAIGGTPGKENSVLPLQYDPALDSLSVIAPSSPEWGEPVSITISYVNTGREPLTNVSVILQTSTTAYALQTIFLGSVVFTGTVAPGDRSANKNIDISSLPGGHQTLIAIITPQNTTVSANDTLHVPYTVTMPPGTVIINEVMAAPEPGHAEWIEVQNTGDNPISLTDMQVFDNDTSESYPLKPSGFLKKEGYAVITADSGEAPMVPDGTLNITAQAFPSLNNDGDSVSIIDDRGNILYKMIYNNSNTGYSIERIYSNVEKDTDSWSSSTDDTGSTPGRRNSIAYPPIGYEDAGSIELMLTIEPNPFDERVTISYTLPFPLARVRLFVYDRRGRKVAVLRNTHESGAEWSCDWNGCDSNGSKLTAGPYILQLEAFNKQNGVMHAAKQVVVIGSRL